MVKKEKFQEEVSAYTPNVDVDGVQVSSVLGSDGRFEYPDPVPMKPPIGYKQEPSLSELIRSFVRRELSQTAGAADYETFDEADDFDIEDDPLDPLTPYERVFDPPKPLIADPPTEKVNPVSDKVSDGKEGAKEGGHPKDPPTQPPVKEGHNNST